MKFRQLHGVLAPVHLILACGLALAAGASDSGVSPDEPIVRSTSWGELRSVHKGLVGRLDGVVAGAFTDKVAELFAERWTSLDEFAELSRIDSTFGSDVIAAVNEAVTQDRAVVIRANATRHCPPKHVTICRQLIAALDTASF